MAAAIPTIDVSALRRSPASAPGRAVAGALRQACAEVGFVAVTGHGAQGAVADAVAAARRFFALPRARKLEAAPRRWNPQSPNVYRGWFPSSVEGKEGLDVGEPTLSPTTHAALLARPCCETNHFPALLDESWRGAVARSFEGFAALGRALVAALVQARGGDAASVADAFARPASLSTLRFNRYPKRAAPVAVAPDDGAALACASHVDSAALTLLYQDRGGGLQVRDRGGAWRDVPFDPDALVVNSGLALQHLSGGELIATEHRVVQGLGERLSIPFFLEPVPDLPLCPWALGLPASPDPVAPTYECFLRSAMGRFAEYAREGERLA